LIFSAVGGIFPGWKSAGGAHMHRRFVSRLSLLVLTAVLASPPAALAADEWLGTWRLNLSKSRFNPPELAPKGRTLILESAEGGVKTVIEETNSQGQTVRTEYAAKFDNKDIPWSGPIEADTVALQRLDDEYFQTVWKLKGQPMVLGSTLVSKDRKTLTVTHHGKNAAGQEIAQMAVYDRQ
jgi:hypothetical protein